MRTIQYVYSLLFSKIYNRTNRFGINNKSHFDFIFTNWWHEESNLVLPTPTKNKVVEQPIKKIIPENDITRQKQQQQQQQQQNEQEKEEILCAGKRPESFGRRVAHPFEQKSEKNDEVLEPPTTPSPKLFGNTYLFDQKSEKIMKQQQQHYHRLLLSQPLLIHQNQWWMQELQKKRAEKKARLQKQLSENTEKMNVIKKQKLS